MLMEKFGTQNALMFLNYVKSKGYEPMLYANKRDITNRFQKSSFSCKFWLAHYTAETDYKGSFNMWQYTSSGSVPGISGRVDMNVAYFAYGTVAEPKHTHSFTTRVGERKEPTCTEDGSETLRCSCGETNTSVLKKTGHKFGEWKTEIVATETEDGLLKRVCEKCNSEETKKIDKLPGGNSNNGNEGGGTENEGGNQSGGEVVDPTTQIEPVDPAPEKPKGPVPTIPIPEGTGEIPNEGRYKRNNSCNRTN